MTIKIMPELSRISIGHFEFIAWLDVPVLFFFAALYFMSLLMSLCYTMGVQFNYWKIETICVCFLSTLCLFNVMGQLFYLLQIYAL